MEATLQATLLDTVKWIQRESTHFQNIGPNYEGLQQCIDPGLEAKIEPILEMLCLKRPACIAPRMLECC